MPDETQSIRSAMQAYLDMVALARSKQTAQTYGFGLQAFSSLLAERDIRVDIAPVSELPDDAIGWFAAWLKQHSPATEQLYLQAAIGFYQYLVAEQISSPNIERLRQLVKMRSRKTGQRLPQFPREAIEQILEQIGQLPPSPTPGDDSEGAQHLRDLRDRAFLLTLADTGLRVHEVCALRRGDIDWNEGRAIIIGKGDKQAVIRFSTRSMAALKDYLEARATLDGASGRPLQSLPLFARHDKGAGSKVKGITTATGRNIVDERVRQILGEAAGANITPHSFRHYFVTTVLRASGNLKLAQELARHANIAVTQRYAHISDDELDKGYHEIFE